MHQVFACWMQSPGVAEARLSVPILERVRELEEQMPGLEAKLRKHLGRERPRPVSGGGTLVARVEILEEAVDALLQAQVYPFSEHGLATHALCCGRDANLRKMETCPSGLSIHRTSTEIPRGKATMLWSQACSRSYVSQGNTTSSECREGLLLGLQCTFILRTMTALILGAGGATEGAGREGEEQVPALLLHHVTAILSGRQSV